MILAEPPFAKIFEPTVKTLWKINEAHDLRSRHNSAFNDNRPFAGRTAGRAEMEAARPATLSPCVPTDRTQATSAGATASPSYPCPAPAHLSVQPHHEVASTDDGARNHGA